jgi:anti-sigma regulatory factor (Ser/Thr protein kinase)
MIAVANTPIPVVPDTGTEKAARLAAELTGNPGCWVRLDCGHPRHVQHMVPVGAMLDCPSCPPSVDGGLARRRVLGSSAAHYCSARLAADSHAAATARQLAAEAVTAAGLSAVLADVEQVVEELVANATRRTQAPLELTIDAHDDVVRVEVHDQAPRVALGFEDHPGGHRGAPGPAATDSLDRWGAAPPGERDQVLWAELRSGDDGG